MDGEGNETWNMDPCNQLFFSGLDWSKGLKQGENAALLNFPPSSNVVEPLAYSSMVLCQNRARRPLFLAG